MAKTAFITGIAGQDGGYLAKLLLEKGYKVVGGIRRTSHSATWRLEELGIDKDIELVDFELGETLNIFRAIEKAEPTEFYNLGAQSFVAASFEQPLYTSDVDALGVTRILEAIRTINPKIGFYQASTSEMFGKVHETPQRESTPFHPRSPYGVAKLYAHWITTNYRESYDLNACSGILFNHESPIRGENFVTRKVTLHLAQVKHGQRDILELGNMDAKRDWGFAGDYVEGMWLMLQNSTPDDYVLATGETWSVRHFVEQAAITLGMKIEWSGEGANEKGIDKNTGKTVVQINPEFYRPAEVDLLLGDPTKAETVLGWKRKTSFAELVTMMTVADEKRVMNDTLRG